MVVILITSIMSSTIQINCLAGLAKLPTRLYILLALISSFFLFFLLGAKLFQYLLDRFSRSFHQMEGICVHFLDQVQFFRFLKGRCHGNQFCGKITYPLALIALAFRNGIG